MKNVSKKLIGGRSGFTQHHFSKMKSDAGFALVELLVALGIFTSVMVIAGTSFFVIMNANKEVRAQQISFDNLNFALDSLLRSARTGSSYSFTGQSGENVCSTGGVFEYVNQDNETVQYRCSSNSLERRVNTGSGWRSWINATATEIFISELYWYYDHLGTGEQPFIVMVITGEVQELGGSRAPFNLQTSISKRTLGN